MLMKNITKLALAFLFILSPLLGVSQMDSKLISITIPKKLTKNTNAVIRKHDVVVEIDDVDDVTITEDRIVTVFNKTGMSYVNAYQRYSDSWKIKDMEAIIYNALGNEIAKIKERDFRDASAVDGGTLYADDRVRFLEYTPRAFPITVHYTSKVETESTAFLPEWLPLENFYCSTESSSYKIVNNADIPVKFKESNFEEFPISKLADFHYEAKNLVAIKNEAFRPDFRSLAPSVKFAMKDFVMEGVRGVNNDWKDFGKWMYDELLTGTQTLPDEVKLEIKQLTNDASTDIEKARIVYQYVQDRSRYISVQVGIGGWKPINASEVHEMAYGDCKGLSNYTMALMDEVGVKSHYAAIYGGTAKKSMDSDFSMTEGNHVILYLPDLDADEDYWLECTSKNAPFGYMSDFTDDRDALVITSEGGKLVHTTQYNHNDNLQKTNGTFTIQKNGNVMGDVVITTEGVQYAWRSDLELKSESVLKHDYLGFWEHLNGLIINSASNSTDKLNTLFKEQVELETPNYGSLTGDLLIFQPNILNRHKTEPPIYENRQFDIEVERGYIDEDQYDIVLADGLSIDALPEPVELETKFGSYNLHFDAEDAKKIKVFRRVEIKAGLFDKSDYQEFREFRSNIVKYDSSRGVLKISK